MIDTPADSAAVLREVLRELVRLRRTVENIADRAAASVLLPAIAHANGERDFTAAELLRLARTSLAGADQLQTAIECVAGPCNAGVGRRIGRLLARVAHIAGAAAVEGYSVQMIGEARAGRVYVVRPAPASASLPVTKPALAIADVDRAA